MLQEKIDQLRDYFLKRDDIILAFLFGSQAKGLTRPSSDWDVALYFKPRQWGEESQGPLPARDQTGGCPEVPDGGMASQPV